MVKAENSAEPYIGFVNDTRSSRIADQDFVDVFWMYRKSDVDNVELKRQEKKTPLLSSEQEIFFSHHQDRAPVQSVFQQTSVRIEIAEERRESRTGKYTRPLEDGQMVCRFLYDYINKKFSVLKREDIPSNKDHNKKSEDRSAKQSRFAKRKSSEHQGSSHVESLDAREGERVVLHLRILLHCN